MVPVTLEWKHGRKNAKQTSEKFHFCCRCRLCCITLPITQKDQGQRLSLDETIKLHKPKGFVSTGYVSTFLAHEYVKPFVLLPPLLWLPQEHFMLGKNGTGQIRSTA